MFLKDDVEQRARVVAITVSILIHLLLFLFWGYLDNSDQQMLELKEKIAQLKEKQEKRLEFQLIETPDDKPEAIPEEETELVSDKNMQAADLVDGALPFEDPFSEGQIETEAFADEDQQLLSQEQEPTQTEEQIDKSEELFASNAENIKAKDEKEVEDQQKPAEPSKLKKLLFDNTKSQSRLESGMSLNTYAWDYAPYLLTLKKVIGSNLDLPYAFTHMGIIGGDVIVEFVVDTKGHLQANRIVRTNAHESLQQASYTAVDKSFPFLPLPANFPEDKLIVTATFRYIIEKR